MRGEKAAEEIMLLENKLKQIEADFVNAQQELENTTKQLETKEKTLTNVRTRCPCIKCIKLPFIPSFPPMSLIVAG